MIESSEKLRVYAIHNETNSKCIKKLNQLIKI